MTTLRIRVNSGCEITNVDGLRISTRAERWGPSSVFFVTAVSTGQLYHLVHVRVSVNDRDVIVLQPNSFIGDSSPSCSSARRRLRLTAAPDHPFADDEEVTVYVLVSKVEYEPKQKRPFEERSTPVDDYVTPFGRRNYPVSL